MYVSLEMVYLCQGYFLSQDLRMYDSSTSSPAECHASGMCADLGQVQYVLSDKTGTLTRNMMTLRRCSVAGILYGCPILPPQTEDDADEGMDDMTTAHATGHATGHHHGDDERGDGDTGRTRSLDAVAVLPEGDSPKLHAKAAKAIGLSSLRTLSSSSTSASSSAAASASASHQTGRASGTTATSSGGPAASSQPQAQHPHDVIMSEGDEYVADDDEWFPLHQLSKDKHEHLHPHHDG